MLLWQTDSFGYGVTNTPVTVISVKSQPASAFPRDKSTSTHDEHLLHPPHPPDQHRKGESDSVFSPDSTASSRSRSPRPSRMNRRRPTVTPREPRMQSAATTAIPLAVASTNYRATLIKFTILIDATIELTTEKGRILPETA